MRIAIDGHSIGTKTGGNEVYTENLITYLSKIDKRNEYIIYINPDINLNLPGNFKIKKIPTKNRYLRQLYLFRLLKNDSPDIYHSQYFLPLLCPCNSVITVHDVSFIGHPEWWTTKERFIFSFLNNSIKNAEKIIAVSNWTKMEIIRHFNIDENKISVIYNGVCEVFNPDIDKALIYRIKSRYSLPDKYIVYVGRFNVRKNISTLIKAFSIFKGYHKNDIKLVLVGKEEWKTEDITRLIYKLNLQNEVISTGYIPNSDLPVIYNSAKIFVFPSLYEGFGLPPLEAMASGVPTITSDIPIFSELFGNVTINVPPLDINEMAKAMEKLIIDTSFREDLIQKGLEIAKKFKWDKTAEETIELYKDIIRDT